MKSIHKFNKKAMELSVNFIVMLILAIAVFGFGLYFTQQLFSQAGEIKAQLDKDSEAQISSLLDRGELVAVPVASKPVKSGGLAVYGLGVMNILKGDDVRGESLFIVLIKCSTYITKGNEAKPEKCTDAPNTWTFDYIKETKNTFEQVPFTLKKNEKKIIPIAIQPPTGKPAGTYAFTVNVTTGTPKATYGGAPIQIYLELD